MIRIIEPEEAALNSSRTEGDSEEESDVEF